MTISRDDKPAGLVPPRASRPAAQPPASRLAAIGPGRAVPPQAVAQQARKALFGGRAVGSFVPKLTRKAFEKYGFSTAALLTDWSSIVGQQLAQCSVPERLKWPKHLERGGEIEPGAEGRPGATLLLKVDSSRALDVEYRRAEIVERVNSYFGYRAVAELKVVQAPAGSLAPRPARQPERRTGNDVRAVPIAELSTIPDEGLRAALARMQAGITAGRRG